jgi:hypothetical protein
MFPTEHSSATLNSPPVCILPSNQSRLNDVQCSLTFAPWEEAIASLKKADDAISLINDNLNFYQELRSKGTPRSSFLFLTLMAILAVSENSSGSKLHQSKAQVSKIRLKSHHPILQ